MHAEERGDKIEEFKLHDRVLTLNIVFALEGSSVWQANAS